MHEFELIKRYFSKLSKNNKSSLNLNDDVFFDKSKKLVVTVDTYVEGIHFIDFKCNVGRKYLFTKYFLKNLLVLIFFFRICKPT